MDLVKQNLDYLHILKNSNKKMRKAILINADRALIDCLCECILNCLNGNVRLNDEIIVKLKRLKNAMRQVISKNQSFKKRKNILIQKGEGILPFLLPAVISAISSLVK